MSSTDMEKIHHVEAVDLDPEKPRMFTGISTDSRAVHPGDIFIALKGERFDGHNFITKAVDLGAAAVIIEHRWAKMNAPMLGSLMVPRLVVEDSIHALGELATQYRRKFKIPIIAIAGSNGKTTTKDMIAAVLGTKYSVLATEGNLNNHIGVPQTLFRLEKNHKVAVIEMGTNHPGELAYLSGILEPTHTLITNVGHEHLEFFGNIAGVAKAEGEVVDWLRANRAKQATVFLNTDDGYLPAMVKGIKSVVSYGFTSKTAYVKGISLALNSFGCARFQVKAGRSPRMDVELGVPGPHNALNALAAVAVGITFKVPAGKIQKALASFSPSTKRMEVIKVDGITILDDTYNSNPDSVRAALETLSSITVTGKRIAVLADMLELGSAAGEQHRAVGRAVGNGIEYLLTYGPLAQLISQTARSKSAAHYEQKNALSEQLARLVTPGDVVLIKGSRGMKMEEVVMFLKERFSKAA